MKEDGTKVSTKREVKEEFKADQHVLPVRNVGKEESREEPDDDQHDRCREVLDAQKQTVDHRFLQTVFKRSQKSKPVKEDLNHDQKHEPYWILKERDVS